MTPRRIYRVAVRAYPRAWRSIYADDLLTTLAALDRDRGRASVREVLSLLRGAATARYRPLLGARRLDHLVGLAALALLAAAVSPATLWGRVDVATGPDAAIPVLVGPASAARVVLVAVAVAALVANAPSPLRRPALAAAGAGIAEAGLFTAAHLHATRHEPFAMSAFTLSVISACALSAAAVALALRLSRPQRLLGSAGSLMVIGATAVAGAAVARTHVASPGRLWPWELGPAGWVASAGVALACVCLIGARHVDDRASGASARASVGEAQ
jgi:hypothetical protein